MSRLATKEGVSPFRWWVFDRYAEPCDIASLPGPESPIWDAHYDNAAERAKRTTQRVAEVCDLGPVFKQLQDAGSVSQWHGYLNYPVLPDPTMHGGGVHVTSPGGVLCVHLDYDRHPKLPGWRRALNLILFLNPKWEESWGGALVLCDPMGNVVERVLPAPGRLVAFEVSDLSYHGVEPVTGPIERVTAAVYYLSIAGPQNTRLRAMFLPLR